MKYFNSVLRVALLLAATTCVSLAQMMGEPGSTGTFGDGLLRHSGGYFDTSGKLALKPQWDAWGDFSEGLAAVGKKAEFEGRKNTGEPNFREFAKWGFIDKQGKTVIPLEWDGCRPFQEGFAIVFRNNPREGKTVDPKGIPYKIGGYINPAGKIAIPPAWEDCRPFRDGMAAVQRRDKWGFIDRTGKLVIALDWDMPLSYESGFSEGLAAVAHNGKWGFIDKKGKIVIPLRWKGCLNFSEGLAAVQSGGDHYEHEGELWGFIDKKGKVVIPPKWFSVHPFSEGLAVASSASGKHGYIDKSGAPVVPQEWEKVQDFRDGLGPVGRDGKWGYVDKTGRVVIQPKWKISTGDFRFTKGLAVVDDEVIDKKGNVIFKVP